jgi:hypothetical protein
MKVNKKILRRISRLCALALLRAGAHYNGKWSPEERRNFNTAFNALQCLAGNKIMMKGEKLVTS